VLSSYVRHQEQLHSTLQHQMTWYSQPAADSKQSAAAISDQAADKQQEQQQQLQQQGEHSQAAAAAFASLPLPQQRERVPAGPGYVVRLLASATPQDVQHVVQASAGSVQEFLVHVFRAITSVLELAKRSWPAVDGRDVSLGCGSGTRNSNGHALDEQQQQQQQQPAGGASSSSSGSAESIGRSPGSADRSTSTTCDTDSGSAAAAVAAAAADCGDEDTRGLDALRAASAEARRELEWHVDHYLRTCALLMLHNPMALYAAGASNLVTREMAAAPPQHWLQVGQC
jgi:hypothetical protein